MEWRVWGVVYYKGGFPLPQVFSGSKGICELETACDSFFLFLFLFLFPSELVLDSFIACYAS